jgi:hypothetical protein
MLVAVEEDVHLLAQEEQDKAEEVMVLMEELQIMVLLILEEAEAVEVLVERLIMEAMEVQA